MAQKLRVNPIAFSVLAAGLLAWAAVLIVIAAIGRERIVPRFFNEFRAEHFISFYVIGFLAAAALPTLRLRWLFVALLALATGTELARYGISRDFARVSVDWLCNVAGAAAALAPIFLCRLRDAFKADTQA